MSSSPSACAFSLAPPRELAPAAATAAAAAGGAAVGTTLTAAAPAPAPAAVRGVEMTGVDEGAAAEAAMEAAAALLASRPDACMEPLLGVGVFAFAAAVDGWVRDRAVGEVGW